MRNKFLRKALAIPAVSGTLLMLANAASAATLKQKIQQSADETGGLTGAGLSSVPLTQTIGTIIQGFLGLLGTVFVLLIIYAGFLYMTASGNEDQVTKAKDILKNAIIGIVIIFLAYAITNFVIGAIAV